MRTPKAKIIKAHALADELLGLYQSAVRSWMMETHRDDLWTTDDLVDIVDVFRRMRVEVEGKPPPDKRESA